MTLALYGDRRICFIPVVQTKRRLIHQSVVLALCINVRVQSNAISYNKRTETAPRRGIVERVDSELSFFCKEMSSQAIKVTAVKCAAQLQVNPGESAESTLTVCHRIPGAAAPQTTS